MTVAALRKRLGWTQDKLARIIDVQPRTISLWETGVRRTPMAVILLLEIWADRRCPEWVKRTPEI
ncbi:MAG: helix-turn-helix transcriptional regulator [Planctomycetes bacterium]|nr:helix-turn-helix transcriptional regulator [Planctomycetota bacterium]